MHPFRCTHRSIIIISSKIILGIYYFCIMINQLLEDKKKEIESLCRLHKVATLAAFGSVCTDKFNENSDVDFLVTYHSENIAEEDYADNYLDFIDELESLLGKKVDLVNERILKNPYFIKTIAKTKTPIYEG